MLLSLNLSLYKMFDKPTLSMGGGLIRQTIEDDDLRAIARDFGVTINEAFLN